MSDRLSRLEVARDALAGAVTDCESKRDLPSLVREYRATLAEIAELTKNDGQAVDSIDEIAARRSARGGSTARPRRAAGKSS